MILFFLLCDLIEADCEPGHVEDEKNEDKDAADASQAKIFGSSKIKVFFSSQQVVLRLARGKETFRSFRKSWLTDRLTDQTTDRQVYRPSHSFPSNNNELLLH